MFQLLIFVSVQTSSMPANVWSLSQSALLYSRLFFKEPFAVKDPLDEMEDNIRLSVQLKLK